MDYIYYSKFNNYYVLHFFIKKIALFFWLVLMIFYVVASIILCIYEVKSFIYIFFICSPSKFYNCIVFSVFKSLLAFFWPRSVIFCVFSRRKNWLYVVNSIIIFMYIFSSCFSYNMFHFLNELLALFSGYIYS